MCLKVGSSIVGEDEMTIRTQRGNLVKEEGRKNNSVRYFWSLFV